jgi:hypothetical protein
MSGVAEGYVVDAFILSLVEPGRWVDLELELIICKQQFVVRFASCGKV